MVIDLVEKLNMKTIEVRSLLTDKKVEIQISVDMNEIFKIWKILREESYNKSIGLEEAFYAGYVLANPQVREQYKKFKKQNRMFP